MVDFEIKQGDTQPPLEADLQDGDGNPINLQGASVTLCLGRHLRAPVDIIDAAEGRVRYEWQPGDTDYPGEWNAEFVVTFAGGEAQRVPSDGFIRVRIGRSVCGRDSQ